MGRRPAGLLTYKQLLRARSMLRVGADVRYVSCALGVKLTQEQLDAEMARGRAMWAKCDRAKTLGSPAHMVRHPRSSKPIILPPAVPESFTAAVCGDPPPGRRALDRHRPWRPYQAISLASV